MHPHNVGAPSERIALDVQVCPDHFTKWLEAYSLPNQEAVTVAEVLVKPRATSSAHS